MEEWVWWWWWWWWYEWREGEGEREGEGRVEPWPKELRNASLCIAKGASTRLSEGRVFVQSTAL